MSKQIRVLSKTTALLDCNLTKDERLEFADKLAKVNQDIIAEEARQVSIKQEIKAKLTELQARRELLAVIVQRKSETREIEVEAVLDYEKEECRWTRIDTGEVINRRPMNDDERQMEAEV